MATTFHLTPRQTHTPAAGRDAVPRCMLLAGKPSANPLRLGPRVGEEDEDAWTPGRCHRRDGPAGWVWSIVASGREGEEVEGWWGWVVNKLRESSLDLKSVIANRGGIFIHDSLFERKWRAFDIHRSAQWLARRGSARAAGQHPQLGNLEVRDPEHEKILAGIRSNDNKARKKRPWHDTLGSVFHCPGGHWSILVAPISEQCERGNAVNPQRKL
ncbi:hypothetical protein VTI74DRAFT_10658 [Chaetomium olivicolor]